MIVHRMFLVIPTLAALALSTPADAQPVEVGGDWFVTGSAVTAPSDIKRDLLAFGGSVTVAQDVAEDLHAMGFDVEIDGSVTGDVLAAGASVSLDGDVGGDFTASALTLRIGPGSEIAGNARLAAASVIINGPILGALVAAGAEVELNAPVMGDVVLTGDDIRFGPDARIDGQLTYYNVDQIDVPERVISPDRVRYEAVPKREMLRDFGDDWQDWGSPVKLTPWAIIGGFLINLGLFILIGALFLSLAPKTVRRLRRTAETRPGLVILTGAIGLSILFGSIPIAVLSIVGLPLVPIILLLIVLMWFLGYILGAYVMAMRILRSFGAEESPGMAMRLLALAIGITLVALLNFIPFIGWMINFALVLFGVGAITKVLFDSFIIGNGQNPESETPAKP